MTRAHNLVRTAALAFTTALALAACRGEDPAGTASDTSSSSGSETGTTTNDTPTTSAGNTTTGGVDSSTTGEPTTSTDPCANGGGFIDCTTGTMMTTTGPAPQPNGGMCSSDADCISMNCYQIPMFGGVCGECNEDQDCVDAGTGVGCSLSMSGGVCTDGSVGNGCMSDDACMDGLTCGPVIDIPIPGIIPDSCNECDASADCDMGMLCNPQFDIAALSGSKICVAPGSVANGALCDLEADGDMACMSGICAPVDIMGFITVGVCGECETDDDCAMGTACTPGSLGQGGAMGSVCQ